MKSAIRLLLALPLVMMAGLVAPAVSTAAPQHVLKVTFDDLQCVFDTTVGDAVVFQASGDAGGATSWALVENSQGRLSCGARVARPPLARTSPAT